MTEALILCHSVCGNTYLLARQYADALSALGLDTALYRLPDPQYDKLAPLFEASRTYQAAIEQLPILEQTDKLLEADYIFLGSPTYFGNVSTAVKAFMDSCCDFWAEARLAGKKFGCFATASTYHGGGDMSLQAMNIFAQHMGMHLLSVPANVAGGSQPAYGILHASGGLALDRPGSPITAAINDYLQRVINR